MENHKQNLTYNASPGIFEKSKALKRAATHAEKVLWHQIRDRKLNGLKFRRQHPLDRFVADFYCHEAKLVVEVDGGIHDDISVKERDEGRTENMKDLGLSIIRFTNEDVLKRMSWVLSEIVAATTISDGKK